MLTSGGIRHSPSTFTSSPASTTLFRRLVWEGTVPLEIRVDSKELPANSNRGLECYFIQAPRVSYLPLLISEIKRFLQDVVFDDEAARLMKEEDWWFESEEGHLLKWCVSPERARMLPPTSLDLTLQALAHWAYL
jgi:autophagy-related protein 5